MRCACIRASRSRYASAPRNERRAASETVIDVRGLTKRYGDRVVVDHFDMRVQRGRIFGFLGPNGSGKTTTIRMLCGLLTPDEGEGTCLGYDIIRESRLIKREVGYMTQKFGLYEDLSIEENLLFIGQVYEVPRPRRAGRATLERLGLASRRRQLAGDLSGGWKQRLALAACLLHDPQLLLLDEPTAGVDPMARREFWDHLHQLAAEGLTVLVSTHYMDEAERCHELAYISYGKLLAHGTAERADRRRRHRHRGDHRRGPGAAWPRRCARTRRSAAWRRSAPRCTSARRRARRWKRRWPRTVRSASISNTSHRTWRTCSSR